MILSPVAVTYNKVQKKNIRHNKTMRYINTVRQKKNN